MRCNLIIGLSFISLFYFTSCGNDKASQENPDAKKDTTESEYMKGASRDPKNYLSDCKKLYAQARKLDSTLLLETEIDPKVANAAIQAFTDLAYYCPNDTLAPVFLIKTAQVARAVNNIPQAKQALEKCLSDHPDFKNLPAAIFLLAQLYDEPSYLNNEQEAKKLYEHIINEYPKSDWAASAKGALKFIGKSDEELLKELKKKNKS